MLNYFIRKMVMSENRSSIIITILLLNIFYNILDIHLFYYCQLVILQVEIIFDYKLHLIYYYNSIFIL